MSKKDKLVQRFLSMPSDFHFDEMVRLQGYFGFEEVKKGRTSGSRVKFRNHEGVPVYMHKPHPNGIMKKIPTQVGQRNIRIMKHLEYKGFSGTIEYSQEDKLLFGKVLGIKGLLSYEGSTGTELEAEFKAVIDEYLADCKEAGILPEKPFKGSFNVRIPSDLHRDAALKALELNTSLNGFVSESIRERLLRRR